MHEKSNCGSGLANDLRAFPHRQCLPRIQSDIGPLPVPSHECNLAQINFQLGLRDVEELFPCRHVLLRPFSSVMWPRSPESLGTGRETGAVLQVGTTERRIDLKSPSVTRTYTSVYFGIGRKKPSSAPRLQGVFTCPRNTESS
jgi:hypothetical protein